MNRQVVQLCEILFNCLHEKTVCNQTQKFQKISKTLTCSLFAQLLNRYNCSFSFNIYFFHGFVIVCLFGLSLTILGPYFTYSCTYPANTPTTHHKNNGSELSSVDSDSKPRNVAIDNWLKNSFHFCVCTFESVIVWLQFKKLHLLN